MTKIIGALGAMSIGLLIVFYYLIGEKEEAKSELKNTKIEINLEAMEMDKSLAMKNYFIAKDFGNKEEMLYYKAESEKIDSKIKAIYEEKKKEKERLEKIRKQTEEFYNETGKAVKQAEKNLEKDAGFYGNYGGVK